MNRNMEIESKGDERDCVSIKPSLFYHQMSDGVGLRCPWSSDVYSWCDIRLGFITQAPRTGWALPLLHANWNIEWPDEEHFKVRGIAMCCSGAVAILCTTMKKEQPALVHRLYVKVDDMKMTKKCGISVWIATWWLACMYRWWILSPLY